MGERRKHARVPQDLKTELPDQLAQYFPETIRILDLSNGGVRFATKRRFWRGEIVKFTIPLAVPIPIKARIVWAHKENEPKIYGAEFKEIAPKGKGALRSYLEIQMNALGIRGYRERS